MKELDSKAIQFTDRPDTCTVIRLGYGSNPRNLCTGVSDGILRRRIVHNVFWDVGTSRPHSSSTVSSSPYLSHRVASIWFPFVALAVLFTLSDLFLPLVEAGCRTNSGSPMCCLGRQTACHSTTWDDGPDKNVINQRVRNVVEKRCFCDEHCVTTRDCCPDYHEVCRKFNRLFADCTVSEWGPWSECDHHCGPGKRVRRRRVLQAPTIGGRQCPILEESVPCEGTRCSSKRVGRSGAMIIPYMHQARDEVAQLLPVRGDLMHTLRQHDMRWDVRRKLYLGRLIQQNLTEQPEPEPYCATYQITHANLACRTHNLFWQYNGRNDGSLAYGVTSRYVPYGYNQYSPYRARQRRSWGLWRNPSMLSRIGKSDRGITNKWSSVWMTHASLLTPGQQICVTCYPAYMRCPAVGYLGMETRWRALLTADCQGTFTMVTAPKQGCTCGQGVASFVFV